MASVVVSQVECCSELQRVANANGLMYRLRDSQKGPVLEAWEHEQFADVVNGQPFEHIVGDEAVKVFNKVAQIGQGS